MNKKYYLLGYMQEEEASISSKEPKLVLILIDVNGKGVLKYPYENLEQMLMSLEVRSIEDIDEKNITTQVPDDILNIAKRNIVPGDCIGRVQLRKDENYDYIPSKTYLINEDFTNKVSRGKLKRLDLLLRGKKLKFEELGLELEIKKTKILDDTLVVMYRFYDLKKKESYSKRYFTRTSIDIYNLLDLKEQFENNANNYSKNQ
ncbi:MAG: hypothetical protein PF569_05065 [Candidatus Woesearchaeota archaeon]|jgi:hypothetical protein|nr:hypothetical protein [Candidatus Woesearchaeota archaeon]